MKRISFGRRKFSFSSGRAVLKSTSVTERALNGEDEKSFTERLLRKYEDRQGTIEMVFKRGCPDYAIVSFDQETSLDV